MADKPRAKLGTNSNFLQLIDNSILNDQAIILELHAWCQLYDGTLRFSIINYVNNNNDNNYTSKKNGIIKPILLLSFPVLSKYMHCKYL